MGLGTEAIAHLIQYREEGNRLDGEQVAILKELEVEIPTQDALRDAV